MALSKRSAVLTSAALLGAGALAVGLMSRSPADQPSDRAASPAAGVEATLSQAADDTSAVQAATTDATTASPAPVGAGSTPDGVAATPGTSANGSTAVTAPAVATADQPDAALADGDTTAPGKPAPESADLDALAEAWLALAGLLDGPDQAHLAQVDGYAAATNRLISAVEPRHPLLGLEDDQIQALATRLAALQEAHEEAVRAKATALGIPVDRMVDDRPEHLIGFAGDTPLYETPTNVEAAITTGVSFVRQSAEFGSDVDGNGFGALVYDGGVVRHHDEFRLSDGTSRIAMMEPVSVGTSGHADHVAGTIAAEGKNPEIKGMAPAARIRSEQWTNSNWMILFGQTRPGRDGQVVVSNTSLGSSGAGDGRYTSSDANLDSIVFSLGYFLPFASAGNDGKWYSITGYDKESKNSMTVASASQVERDADGGVVSGGSLSGFSSRGPIDDGRIKPDITANGQSVKSTSGDSTGTSSKQGTSMSSPNAAGSAIIVQDYFSKRFPGHLLRSHMLKGLICHSADDFGETGPDYKYGWGIFNALEACRLIRHYEQHPETRALVEDFLQPDEVLDYPFTWDGSTPITATLSWIERPGQTSSAEDDRNPDLVNDLDIRIIDPDGTEHLPWVMPYVIDGFVDGDQKKQAVRGDNTTDNVEQVVIATPTLAGEYIVRVSHKGSLDDGDAQHFGLCIEGTAAGGASLPAPSIASIDASSGSADQTRVGITGSGFLLGAQVLLVDGGSTVASASAVAEVEDRMVCWFDLANIPAGTYQLVVRNPDGQQSTESIPFVVQAREILISEDFEGGFTGGWSHGADTGSDDWQLAAGVGGAQAAFVPNNASTTLSHLVSPTVTVPANALDLHLSFQHRYEYRGDRDDAGVLEVRRNGGTWYDVIDNRSAGTLVEERYDYPYYGSVLSDDDWQGDPDGDGDDDTLRWAWLFHSLGVKQTTVRLDPATWAGHDIQFRWRFTSDNEVGGGGWWVDDVVLRATVDGSGNNPPEITAGPDLDPDPVTGDSATLSASANDGGDGPAELTYAWSIVDKPTGAPDPSFDPNHSTTADSTTITFDMVGTYRIRLTVFDGALQTTAERDITVLPTATVIEIQD